MKRQIKPSDAIHALYYAKIQKLSALGTTGALFLPFLNTMKAAAAFAEAFERGKSRAVIFEESGQAEAGACGKQTPVQHLPVPCHRPGNTRRRILIVTDDTFLFFCLSCYFFCVLLLRPGGGKKGKN